jgi:cobalt/nickel transport system permease protein
LSAGGLVYAVRRVRATLPPRRVPLIGLAAAFIFAAQMLNFPVAGGTSGHLMGSVLAAVLLGPSAAVMAMSAVLILQALLFNDGGITALGANLFNMALLAPVAGFALYRLARRTLGGGPRARVAATAVAAWCATVLAALACAAELAWSGAADWRVVLPTMGGIHLLIGLGEAFITTLIVAAIARARPELLDEEAQPHLVMRQGEMLVLGLVASLGLVVLVAPLASSLPDGLEKVAAQLGFEQRAAPPAVKAPMPDYQVPGVTSEKLGTILAGAAGTVAVFLAAWLATRLLKSGKPCPAAPADQGPKT